MLDDVIPALYPERVAARSTRAEQRHRLRAPSAQRLAPLQQPSHPIQSLDLQTRRHLEQVAGECADLFQRSSSCVEGRNGFLALHQYEHHRLGPRKQQVLAALHNFSIKRPDNTTAAERFFAQPHPILDRAGARAHALARPTGATTTAPGEATVPRPCGGLATVDQSMIKAGNFSDKRKRFANRAQAVIKISALPPRGGCLIKTIYLQIKREQL